MCVNNIHYDEIYSDFHEMYVYVIATLTYKLNYGDFCNTGLTQIYKNVMYTIDKLCLIQFGMRNIRYL